MERKTLVLTAFISFSFLISFVGGAVGQKKQYSEQIYDAYIRGDMRKWEQVITSLEASGTPSLDAKLELAEYYYAHIGYLLGNGKKEEAKIYLNRAEKLVEGVLKDSPGNATATSLKGIFTAYRMEMNKLKAPVLGPQCMKLIKKAYQIDPENIQAVSDLGNMYYHCPAIFGGDKQLGRQYLKQAADLMEREKKDKRNWYYLNLLAMLAQYEAESGSRDQAKEIYEKILALEPDFVWVRDELYPQLRQ